MLRNLANKVLTNSEQLFRFVACSEIFLMPVIILLMFTYVIVISSICQKQLAMTIICKCVFANSVYMVFIVNCICYYICCSGNTSLFLPFVYYRFLSLRYASQRNRFSRLVSFSPHTQNYPTLK